MAEQTEVLLILGFSYFVADGFLLSKHASTAAEVASEISIAILPFTDMSEK